MMAFENFSLAAENKFQLNCKTDPKLITNLDVWQNRMKAEPTSEFNISIENEAIVLTYESNTISNYKLNSKDQIINSFIKIEPPVSQDLMYYVHITQSGRQIFSIEIHPNGLRIFFYEEDPIATVHCKHP